MRAVEFLSILSKESQSYFTGEELKRKIELHEPQCEPCEGVKEGYSESAKCCTYFPFVPNYRITGLPERVLQELSNQGNFTYMGVHPNREYRKQFALSPFGQNSSLKCPLFQKNQCSIWTQRPGECQLFFCKPFKEIQFKRDMKNFMSEMEFGLSQLSALYAGRSLEEIQWSLSVFDHNESLSLDGEIEKFYKECSELYGQYKQVWIRELRESLSPLFIDAF
ncbi:MAG: hypothetical protein R2827_02080 [Bdellovibrionales bacterium]